MDQFGIGQAMRTAAAIYSQTARRTGRTTQLVESLKAGDRVVFLTEQEAVRVHRLCRERGVRITAITLPVHTPEELFSRSSSEGRTIFDHSWLEAFYALRIDQCASEVENLQRNASGFGEAHRETRRAAEGLSSCRTFSTTKGTP